MNKVRPLKNDYYKGVDIAMLGVKSAVVGLSLP